MGSHRHTPLTHSLTHTLTLTHSLTHTHTHTHTLTHTHHTHTHTHSHSHSLFSVRPDEFSCTHVSGGKWRSVVHSRLFILNYSDNPDETTQT